MRAGRIARLDNLSFDKYGVVFSYLTRSEKQEILDALDHYDVWKKEFVRKRQELKPNFIKLLNKIETPAGALKLVAKHLQIPLTYCPYEAELELVISELDRFVLGAPISSIEDMTEYIKENY